MNFYASPDLGWNQAPDSMVAQRHMQPVVFAGLAGWLHTVDDHGNGDHGGDVAVLLCPAMTRDLLDAHHSFRLLAATLAEAGYPTLRFHYAGTGDSGEDAGADCWSAWQASTDAAIDYLRAATGATRVVLAGLRIGATLAALAAARRSDIAGLMLLAPVLRGQSYMRQLTVEAQLQGSGAVAGLDFQELHLSAPEIARISQVDLRRLALPAGLKVAVFAQAPATLLTACIDAWTARGAHVQLADFAGLDPFLRHNLVDACPLPDLTVAARLAAPRHSAGPGTIAGTTGQPAAAPGRLSRDGVCASVRTGSCSGSSAGRPARTPTRW